MFSLRPASPKRPSDDVRELGWVNNTRKQPGEINPQKHQVFLGGTSRAIKVKNGTLLRLKQRVKVVDVGNGVIRYLGDVSFSKGKWVGVELDKPVGKHSGTVGAIEYFQCKPKCGLFVKTNAVKPLKKEQPQSETALLSPRSRQLIRASVESLLTESHARIEEHREARATIKLMLHGKQQSDTDLAGQQQLRRRVEFFNRQIEQEFENINKTLRNAYANKDQSIATLRDELEDVSRERDDLMDQVANLKVALNEAQRQAFVLQPPQEGLFAFGTITEYKPCEEGQPEARLVPSPPDDRALSVVLAEENDPLRATAGLKAMSPSRRNVEMELEDIAALERQASKVLEQFGNFIRDSADMAPLSSSAAMARDPRQKTPPASRSHNDSMDPTEARGGYISSRRSSFGSASGSSSSFGATSSTSTSFTSPRSSSYSGSASSTLSPSYSPQRRYSSSGRITSSARKRSSKSSSRSGTLQRRSSGSRSTNRSRTASRARKSTRSPAQRYTSPSPSSSLNVYRSSSTSRLGKSRSLPRSRSTDGSRRRHSYNGPNGPSSASKRLHGHMY